MKNAVHLEGFRADVLATVQLGSPQKQSFNFNLDWWQ